MSENILETDWWILELPPEWDASQDDDVIVITDEDEVSVIEISTLCREDRDVNSGDLDAFSADLRSDGLIAKDVSIGTFSGLYFSHQDQGYAVREWYLRQRKLFVYITCSCLNEHAGMDDSAVDEILSTLSAAADEL